MRINLGGGFSRGLATGYAVADNAVNDYKQAQLEQGLADAAQRNQVTEEASQADREKALAELEAQKNEAYNRERDASIDANGTADPNAGLETAQAYDQNIAALRSRGDTPQYAVGKDTYATKQEAQAAADAANNRGMQDVYRQRGRPEMANRLAASDLALKGAKREDQVGEAAQGLKLGSVKNQYALMEQDFQNKVAEGALKGVDLHKAAFGAFADAAESNPALANHIMKQKSFLDTLGITDAEYAPGSNKELVFSMKDGTKMQAKIDDLQAWRNGKQPLKMVEVGAGAKLVGVNPKTGEAKTVAEGNPKPEAADHQRTLVNDAVNQIALAYGAKMDPISKMIDTSTIKDPDGYMAAIKDAETRIRDGKEKPMAVASELATAGRKKAEAQRVLSGGKGPVESGSFSSLWSK